ncbi:MAG: FecR family protein [Oscillospiraceae bacterium]|nr:FecR family protein [Oscillospiraceae bacterium]
MKKLIQFLTEHALVLVIAAISAVSLILILIVFTLASSGSTDRRLVVKDITGSAFILKNDGQIPANKNAELESGDVIITSSDGEVKLSVDKDKFIYIEPDSTLYVNFTDRAEKGSIVVNISEGSAICRIDSKLPKNSAFEVRTPNSVVSAAGTVFRTEFTYLDSYGGHNAVKLTEVECADGAVNIQLYDDNASPADQLMLLAAGKSARLITCADLTRFEYLNCDTDLFSLSIPTLKAYLRISAERPIEYSLSSLNNAYQNAMGISGGSMTEQTAPSQQLPSETAPPAETEISSETNFETAVITSPTASETTLPPTETTPVTTTGTTPISVAETTTRIYNVTTAPAETTELPAVTSPPSVTEEQTTAIPVIKPAAPVTSAPSAITPSESTDQTTSLTETSETTVPVSTIPWWEIINSAALSS